MRDVPGQEMGRASSDGGPEDWHIFGWKTRLLQAHTLILVFRKLWSDRERPLECRKAIQLCLLGEITTCLLEGISR